MVFSSFVTGSFLRGLQGSPPPDDPVLVWPAAVRAPTPRDFPLVHGMWESERTERTLPLRLNCERLTSILRAPCASEKASRHLVGSSTEGLSCAGTEAAHGQDATRKQQPSVQQCAPRGNLPTTMRVGLEAHQHPGQPSHAAPAVVYTLMSAREKP